MTVETIARLLRKNATGEGPLDPRALVVMFADSFEIDDPKFNREKFLMACGVSADY